MHGGYGLPFWGWLGIRGVVIAAIIVGIVFVVRAASRRGGWGGGWPREESALDILQKRYARGRNPQHFCGYLFIVPAPTGDG